MTCSRYAAVVLALVAAACGGAVNGGAVNGGGDGTGGTANVGGSGGAVNVGGAGNGAGGNAGTGGTAGIGGSTGTGGSAAYDGGAGTGSGDAGVNCSAPAPPSIVFQKACAAFVPALMPYEVTFVERTSVDAAGTRMMAHRFRTSSTVCGFDVVISLPGLELAADAAPYELSTWWIQGSVPLGLLAVVLRRPGNRSVLLSVANAGSASLMNNLVAPLAVTLNGPVCAKPGGLARQVLERAGVPLACADEAGFPGLRLCNDGSTTYRMVDYPGQPGTEDVPAIFGASDLLARAP
jgi:hypothetical protein